MPALSSQLYIQSLSDISRSLLLSIGGTFRYRPWSIDNKQPIHTPQPFKLRYSDSNISDIGTVHTQLRQSAPQQSPHFLLQQLQHIIKNVRTRRRLPHLRPLGFPTVHRLPVHSLPNNIHRPHPPLRLQRNQWDGQLQRRVFALQKSFHLFARVQCPNDRAALPSTIF